MADNEQDEQLPAFRLARVFAPGISTSEAKAYRVETSGLLTEKEAMALLRRLESPYQGMKYDDDPLRPSDSNRPAAVQAGTPGSIV